MPTIIHQRVRECRDGTYPKTICKVSSGYVVMGDVQFLNGYCLLYPYPVVSDLNAMDIDTRTTFMREASIIGDAVLELTDAVRINYEILGNLAPALHQHIFPRYKDEPEELRTKPVWFYDWDKAPEFDLERDKPFMDALKEKLIEKGIAK